MSKIIDCITYNGEVELFEIRYEILKDFVDEFRIVEFYETFSGKPKEITFNQNWDKVKSYFPLKEVWSKYEDLAIESPNTEYGKGAKHWVREFCQKESIKDCLTDLQDDDIVFVGDVDEIIDPLRVNWELISDRPDIPPVKIRLIVYSYYLNNRSNEEFWGPILGRYKDIKKECLNHLRANAKKFDEYGGWHFTSLGGYDKVKEKLTDSYTAESYATSQVLGNLENNIKNNLDFLGRNFTYKIDESEWPDYLKNNKEKYKQLCK